MSYRDCNQSKTLFNEIGKVVVRMKKKHNFSLVIAIILLIIVAVAGKIYMDKKSFNDEMVKVVNDNKSIIEKELKAKGTSKRIHKINIDYTTIKRNPMGGIMFGGFVNGEKKLAFSTGLTKYIMSENGEYSDVQSTGVDITEELDDYLSEGVASDK